MADYANAVKWAGIAVAAVVIYKAWQDSGNFLCDKFGILCPQDPNKQKETDPAKREYWEQYAPFLGTSYDIGKQVGGAIQDAPKIASNMAAGDVQTWFEFQARAPPGPVKTAAVIGTAGAATKLYMQIKGVPDMVQDPDYQYAMRNPAVTGGIVNFGITKAAKGIWDRLTCPNCAATRILDGIMPKATAIKTDNSALIFEPGTGYPAVGDDNKYLGPTLNRTPQKLINSEGFELEPWYPGQTNIGPDGTPIVQTNRGTIHQAVVEPTAKKLIPGFNTPMDTNAVQVPDTTQDKGSYQGQYAVYNAPKPAAPKMCPDDKGNLVVCP